MSTNTNFAGKSGSLSLQQVGNMPAEACKLYMLMQAKPGQSDAYYARLMNCSDRSIRNYKKQIPTPADATPTLTELNDEQQAAYNELRTFGYDAVQAKKIAAEYTPEFIRAGIAYVNGCNGVVNPRGLLVTWLRTRKNDPDALNIPRKADPFHQYRQFWHDGPGLIDPRTGERRE